MPRSVIELEDCGNRWELRITGSRGVEKRLATLGEALRMIADFYGVEIEEPEQPRRGGWPKGKPRKPVEMSDGAV